MNDEPAHIISESTTFAAWFAPRMYGVSLWGPQTPLDGDKFFASLEWAAKNLEAPWDFLADNQRLRIGDHDWHGFTRVLAWGRDVMPRLGGVIRKWVTVSPNNALGWAIAGSMRLLRAPFPAESARDVDDALSRLGRPDRATLGPWIDALPARVTERTGLVARLHMWLAATPESSLGDAARRLAMTPRTLQRLLALEGRSFRDLQRSARRSP